MRDKLISTAILLFGEYGFEGTSTRRIASEADTTMSNITYHFGGKEGLYQAAGQQILDRLSVALAEKPVSPLAAGASPEEAMALISQILRNMGEFMLRDDVAPMARFVAREHGDPDSVIGTQLRGHVAVFGTMMKDAIAVLRPDLSPEQCRSRAFFMYAITTGLRNARAPLCTIMEAAEIDEHRGKQLLQDLEIAAREMLARP